MDWKVLVTVFGVVFLAELGDKTQIATLLFATDRDVSKWLVFFGASMALVATSAIGVLAGEAISQLVSPRALGLAAGLGFILIGGFTLIRSW